MTLSAQAIYDQLTDLSTRGMIHQTPTHPRQPNMWLRNNAKRLITVNGSMTEAGYTEFYDIKPGENPAVDVPDALCKSDFVRNLIKTGDLIQTVASEPEDDEELEDLRNEALLHGIDLDKSWDASRIRAEIDKANA